MSSWHSRNFRRLLGGSYLQRQKQWENSESEQSKAQGGKMVQRLTYRRRHSYATKSNKVRKVKTPGGIALPWGRHF